jgi:hypothetical protein
MVVVVICTAIIAVLLLSYLTMLNNSNVLTARSLAWNNALPVAEAGVEEAASAIQFANGDSVNAVLATNGWTSSGNTLTKTRVMSNAYYSVLITSTNLAAAIGPLNPPVIYSTGFVLAPLRSDYIGRTVRVTTKGSIPQTYGILAKDGIKLNGNCLIDSFDPTNPLYNTGGLYDPAKAHDQAKVGCDSFAPGCISINNGLVYGYVNTAFGGSTDPGNNGIVGDMAYVNAGKVNRGTIEVGHAMNNLNVVFQDAEVPFTSGASLGAGNVGGVHYGFIASGSNYFYNGNLTLSGATGSLYVTGNVTLYVTQSFKISGGGNLVISSNSSLTLVVGGPTCSIGGGGVVNYPQRANTLSIQCLPTCTTGDLGGGSSFIGIINAPEADITLHGGASASGAMTARTFTLIGGSSIHYDESLGTNKTGAVYGVASWSEL